MASKQERAAQAAAEAAVEVPGAVPLYESVSVDELADLLRESGYRVTPAEQNGHVQLMSASQGIGFAVRFGNRAAEEGRFFDFTLGCVMQVQGDIPVELVPSWARTKRFARLSAQGQFLVLEMDVVVSGGVSVRHLTSMTQLWDRLMQEFVLHLRNRPAMAAAERPAGSAPGSVESTAALVQSDSTTGTMQ
ncbi:bacterial sensory transduction regulator family protein [Burkholderia sp. WAC0059]|uniref:YbjN domain-containing protein n=1 Tax=Burkholderia sp. WAC0059 TaxID=2066022 RepID=UPI000C7F2DF4|nr:YbjN domain-containing protein [Burkholderia sp. WAC0059]PLZ01729.1 bacterial sensory transduction regulator family protein [Burkholderia sp. WAC0059]